MFFGRAHTARRRGYKPWRIFFRILKWARWVVMILLLLGTYQLVIWNRDYDPRFYHFLSTTPGRTLARVMKWPTFYNQEPHDKPESEYTVSELAWKHRLEERLRKSWPTHRLVTQAGEEHLVRILQRTDENVTVEQSFGGKGRVIKNFHPDMIRSLSTYNVPLPTITWRDVRFQMEYPHFQLIHFGHYTVLTDAPYYQVIESVRELERMHGQYMELFGDLVQHQSAAHSLQVLFFSDETQYREHQDSSAPALETSAGFYSPLEDRMVVFNQYHSEHARTMRGEIQDEINRMMSQANSYNERRAIETMQNSVSEQLLLRGQRETVATLRHEGAHHLSYTHGVHSWFHAENGWLIEGLAVYFESDPPGELPPSHQQTLFHLLNSNRIPPLKDLLAVRKPEDFEKELPGYKGYEAYVLSWGLFHLAMQPEYRDAFFEYMRFIRNPSNIREIVDVPRVQILARHLGLDPEVLEQKWVAHMHAFLR